MAGLLTREKILKTDDRSYKEIQISEWGGKVRVQSLTAGERDQFEESILGAKGRDGSREVVTKNLRAKLVALTVVDKDGVRLFSHEDVTALAAKNGAAIDRLFTVAQNLSGIGQKDMDELVKNSGNALREDFSSPSPENLD